MYPLFNAYFYYFFYSIDEDYNLKITDNALSRDIFPGDYHCLGDNENRPVKWMAIESLLDKKFTAASDVVSGVVEAVDPFIIKKKKKHLIDVKFRISDIKI